MNVDGESTRLTAPNPPPPPMGEAPALAQGAERDKERASGTMESPGTAGFWLSPQQKHVWTLQQEGRAFSATCLVLVEGDLSVEVLERALRQLVARHEILRTVYRRQAGMKFPFQVVLEGTDPAVELVDLSGLSDSEQSEQLQTLLRKEQALSVGPTQGPVLTVQFARLGPDRTALILALPALAADSRSLQVLVRELGQIAGGTATEEGEEPLRYVQFAQWQNDLLEGKEESSAEGQEFWKNHGEAPPAPALPNELKVQDGYSPRLWSATLDDETWRSVESLAARLDCSAAEILLAAWQSVLWRLSGQTTLRVGTVFDGREYDELRDAVGLIEKTIPLDARFDSDFRFREVVEHVRTAMARAAEWQEHFVPGSGIGSEPQVSFEFVEHPATQKHGNLSFTLQQVFACSDCFKLKLSAVKSGNGLRLEFHYDGSRLARDSAERVSGYFQTLLAAAVADPEMQVGRLALLSEAERRQVVVDWNRTAADYPRTKCLHELFETQAALVPDRPALRFDNDLLSYRELNERANQLAHFLQGLGVGPDSLVGLCVERSAEMMVALLAILKAGGAYVPLNPDNPKPRLAQQLVGAVALITQVKLLAQIPEFSRRTVCLDHDQKLWSDHPRTNPASAATPDNLVYVIYTSGSTGVPKGVAVRHRNLVNYSHFITRRLRLDQHPDGLHFGTVSTIGADLGNTCIYPALISGGCLHVISYEDATDAQRFADYTGRHPLDVLKIVPSHLQALLQTREAKRILPSKYLIMGGETLTSRLLETIEGLGGSCEVLNHYGPTETTVGSLTLRLTDYDWKNATAASIPIGRPIANTQVYILDALQQPVPMGVTGELYIAGNGVTAGYLKQPERTAERFVPNPFIQDDRATMYRTGDLARYLPDGNIEFLGRGDDQVKIRGFRIELGEIETALARHPRVEHSVVVVREDRPGERRLVAYVVPKPKHDLIPAELRTHLEQTLPIYMVPGIFGKLDALPLTDNGKIDRRALPPPEWSQAETGSKAAPSDQLELILVRIWQRVLGVADIGVDDNFFHLGGHSLLAVRLLSEVEKVVGRKVPLASLFRGSTVASLAKLLREGTESDPEPLVVEYQAGDGVTPSFFAVAAPGVRSLGYAILARRMGENQPFYKLQAQSPVVYGRELNPEQLRSLAQQYLAGMRAVQPEGPYFLAAMCGGCHIAEQMILQLEAQGHEVGLYAIFDTWALENTRRRLHSRLFGYQQRLRWLGRVNLRERLNWIKRALGDRIGIWTGKAEAVQQPWQQAYWPENFIVPSFRAPVVLFKRPKQPSVYVDDPQLGWGARSKGGVEMHEIDANHHEILREPHVQLVTQVLAAHLNQRAALGASGKA
jgi:amino acid adenylation domain-containing protein